MKRLILSWLMATLITTLSFSQSIYPKKVLIGNDTIVAVTEPQLKVINRSLNDYTHLQDAYKILQVDLSAQDSIIHLQSLECQALDSLVRSQDLKIDFIKKDYTEQLKYEKSLFTQYKKKSRKTTIGVGVGGTLLGFILGVLLIK